MSKFDRTYLIALQELISEDDYFKIEALETSVKTDQEFVDKELGIGTRWIAQRVGVTTSRARAELTKLMNQGLVVKGRSNNHRNMNRWLYVDFLKHSKRKAGLIACSVDGSVGGGICKFVGVQINSEPSKCRAPCGELCVYMTEEF